MRKILFLDESGDEKQTFLQGFINIIVTDKKEWAHQLRKYMDRYNIPNGDRFLKNTQIYLKYMCPLFSMKSILWFSFSSLCICIATLSWQLILCLFKRYSNYSRSRLLQISMLHLHRAGSFIKSTWNLKTLMENSGYELCNTNSVHWQNIFHSAETCHPVWQKTEETCSHLGKQM